MNQKPARQASAVSLWWYIFLVIPFLHWVGILYAGVNAKSTKWKLFGFLYGLPTILLFLFSNTMSKEAFGYNLIMTSFILSWVASFIHSLAIGSKYREKLGKNPTKYITVEQGYGIQGNIKYGRPELDNEHSKQLRKAMYIRDEIVRMLDKPQNQDSLILSDVKPMVEKYIDHTKELIERDNKLKSLLKQISPTDIDRNINVYTQKMGQAESPMVRKEYEKAIGKYKEQKKTYKDIQDQYEMTKLRLNSTLMSLEQVKYDVIKLESVVSDEERKRFIEDFENKALELGAYLDILKENNDGLSL